MSILKSFSAARIIAIFCPCCESHDSLLHFSRSSSALAPPHRDFLRSPIGFEDLVEYRRADLMGLPPDRVQVLIHASIKFVLVLFGTTWGFLQVEHHGLYYPLRLFQFPPFRHLVGSYIYSADLGQMTPSLMLMIPILRVPSSLDASVQPLKLGVGLWLRLELGSLFQSTAQFSESEVDQSYRAHLNFVPDFLWFDCEYNPQGCLRQLVMAAENCVAYSTTVECSVSLLSGKPRSTRVRSCQTSRSE